MRTLDFPLIIAITCLSTACSNNSERLWSEEERQLLIEGLNSSQAEILDLTSAVDDSLWNYRISPDKWSVGDVIEHLILQDRAYYREIKVVSSLPEMPQYVEVVKGNDETFLEYANDPNKSKADWDVTPTGRFCSKEDGLLEFQKVRTEIINLVSGSKSDFRKVFTFRKIPQEVIDRNPEFYRVRQVRDLHQLVLNAIAHTERHAKQINRIKSQSEN